MINELNFRSCAEKPETSVRIVKNHFTEERSIPFGFFTPPTDMLWIGDIIQDSYRKDMKDMFYDIEFFEYWVAELLNYNAFNSLILYTDRGQSVSIEDYIKNCRQIPVADQEPPIGIAFGVGDLIQVRAMLESWYMVGGEMPYHDSYTYVLFSRDIKDRKFLDYLESKIALRESSVNT